MTYEEFARINDSNEISIDKVDVKNGVVYSSIGTVSSEKFIKGVLETKWHVSNPAMLKGLFEPQKQLDGMKVVDITSVNSFNALCECLDKDAGIRYNLNLSDPRVLLVFTRKTPTLITKKGIKIFKAFMVQHLINNPYSYSVNCGIWSAEVGCLKRFEGCKNILCKSFNDVAGAILRCNNALTSRVVEDLFHHA